MSNAETATNRVRGDAEPLPPELIQEIREALGGDYSRKSLGSLGVHHTTMTAALAKMPIAAGSRALIRNALKDRERAA